MAITSWETFRARPCGVDGDHVRVEMVLDEDFAHLDASETVRQQLLEHMGEEVEVEARLERAWDGTVLGGEVVGVTPMTPGDDTIELFRQWFRDNAARDWSDVVDVEAELGRYDDELC